MELNARREWTTGGRQRCAALGVAVVLATAMLTGCGSKAGPTASGSPTTTPAGSTSAPAATPTPSATHPTGRNLAMTDAEALLRMTDPQTGEKWFGKPRPISAPAWAARYDQLNLDWQAWYELGRRGDATIVGVDWDNPGIGLILERAPDGSFTQIDYPSPRYSATNAAYPAEDFGVPHDPDTYYDTFAVPSQLALPSGDPLTPLYAGYTYGFVPADDAVNETRTRSSSGVNFAGFEIVRDDESVEFIWGSAYDIALPQGLSIENWSYTLQTPWGTEMLLDYDPLGPIKSVVWNAAAAAVSRDPDTEYFLDINESQCCGDIRDRDSVVGGLTDADWVAAGEGTGGRTVYIPTKRNPLLAVMYRLYAEHHGDDSVTAAGGGALGQEEWRLRPGLIAYKTPLTGSWVVYLNSRLTAAKQWG